MITEIGLRAARYKSRSLRMSEIGEPAMRAKQFNRALEDLLRSQADCQLLAFNLPMQADYIADDGFHPSAVTYGLWAGVAAKAITAVE